MGTTIISCGAIIVECIFGVILNAAATAVEIGNSNKVADAQLSTEAAIKSAYLNEQHNNATGFSGALFD